MTNALRTIVLTMLITANALAAFARQDMTAEMKTNYYLGKLKSDDIKPAERVKYIDSLNRAKPGNENLYLKEKARAYVRASRFGDAAECYSRIAGQKDVPAYIYLDAVYWEAWCHLNMGLYEQTLDNVYKIVVCEKPDSLDYYDVEADFLLCSVYRLLENYTMSHRYLQAAQKKTAASKSPQELVYNLKYRYHLELAGLYLREGKYNEALAEDKKGMKYNLDPATREALNMDMAELYDQIGEPAIAEEYFRKFINGSTNSFHNSGNRVNALSNYAYFLYRHGRTDESLRLCMDLLHGPDSTNMLHIRGNLYDILAQNLKRQGRHDEAYLALRQSVEILDSVTHSSDLGSISSITRNFESRMAELEQSRERASGRKMRIAATILCILAVAAAATVLWTWRRSKKRKRENIQLAKEMEHKEEQHRASQKETTDKLDAMSREAVALSMRIAESDALLAEVASIAADASMSSKEAVSAVRTKLRGIHANDRTWEVFRLHFEKIHPNFLTELYRRHPGLTQSEIRMATFIIMNLTGKEIANLTCRSERTVESTKYRLHKKLGLESGISTATYLRSMLAETSETDATGDAKV